MSRLIVLTAAEQVAAHLRNELLRGTWSGSMPGGDRLAAELGIGRDTVEAALRQLETDGLLVNQGRRRGRLIRLPECGLTKATLRVAFLVSETLDLKSKYMVELQHALEKEGHDIIIPGKSMHDLRMDVGRIARLVKQTAADAWVVVAGPREILEWFSAQTLPVMALAGRRRGLPIASVGPDMPPAYAAATRRLVELGHRRIVLLARSMRRLPQPGASERAFLGEIVGHGLLPGPYHLPDWKENIKGFQVCLASLFRLTPPTALLVDEAAFYVATLQFCANRGLRVPQDVSLVCTDDDPTFAWCQPRVAHIHWDNGPLVRRILRWAANVSCGKADVRQTLTPAKFMPGGTIGPVEGS